jgi:hypothetical protein
LRQVLCSGSGTDTGATDVVEVVDAVASEVSVVGTEDSSVLVVDDVPEDATLSESPHPLARITIRTTTAMRQLPMCCTRQASLMRSSIDTGARQGRNRCATVVSELVTSPLRVT